MVRHNPPKPPPLVELKRNLNGCAFFFACIGCIFRDQPAVAALLSFFVALPENSGFSCLARFQKV